MHSARFHGAALPRRRLPRTAEDAQDECHSQKKSTPRSIVAGPLQANSRFPRARVSGRSNRCTPCQGIRKAGFEVTVPPASASSASSSGKARPSRSAPMDANRRHQAPYAASCACARAASRRRRTRAADMNVTCLVGVRARGNERSMARSSALPALGDIRARRRHARGRPLIPRPDFAPHCSDGRYPISALNYREGQLQANVDSAAITVRQGTRRLPRDD